MKFWKRSTLFILSVVALSLAGPSTLLAQLSDLPLKPGLWETHVTTKAGPTNNSAVGQSCFTAGTTLGDYLTASNKGSGAQCSISNKVQSAHGISYDTRVVVRPQAPKDTLIFSCLALIASPEPAIRR